MIFKEMIKVMSDEDKQDLIINATAKGIDIEKEVAPALEGVMKQLKSMSGLMLKNIEYMKGED